MFVNVFGGIMVCDVVVNGIKGVFEMFGVVVFKLFVVCFDGNCVDEGCVIFVEYVYLFVILVVIMDEGVDKVVEFVNV